MKHLKIYEEFSKGVEKYMIVTKDETLVVDYINNYSKQTKQKMSALFSSIDSIDPTEPRMIFDKLEDAQRALDGISVSNFYRVFDVDSPNLVKFYIVSDPPNRNLKEGSEIVSQEEFDSFMNNLKIEKVFIGLFSGNINI